ncbi:MAG: hypothetical protein ACYC61_15570 [Isosphaeraceae bacterium]
MKNPRHSGNRRARRTLSFGPEILETRALLSTTVATAGATFNGPSLSDLIQQARSGTDTAPAAIGRMEQALQTQLTSGPLADLKAGKISGNGFVTEVQNLEASYEQNLDQQLSPEFPVVDALLKLQGQKVVADVIALNQEASVGLISSATLATDARTAINSLTTSPIDPLNPSLSAYTSATQLFETELNTLAQSLTSSSASSTSLTPAQASATALAETQAFLANMHAGLQVVHPNVSSQVDAAVSALESAESGLVKDTATAAQAALTSAVSTFDTAMRGSGGVFDPAGPVANAINRGAFTPNTGQPQAGVTLASVSGTATQGGKATLTATLTGSGGGSAVAGETVSFTLDGAFAGVATTDSKGVATLTGVPTSKPVGIDSGGVVAYFAGNQAYQSASATGDLTVS